MRNFKKVMALAVSVAAICTSVSAFAELEYNYYEGEVLSELASYDADAHALTLNVATNGDATVLVLDNGVEDTAATGEDILYINQYTEDETAYSTMKLKGTALAAGTYVVKYGYTDANGDFAIAEGQLVVSEKQAQEPQYVTVLWGDIDSDDDLTTLDASAIVSALLGSPEDTEYVVGEVVPGTAVTWGDIDSDDDLTTLDASAIVSALLGSPEDTEYVVGEEVQLPIVSE